MFLKASKEDDIEVASLTHSQLFRLSVKLAKENEKLKKNNSDPKDYVEFLENNNTIFSEEITSIRCESLN